MNREWIRKLAMQMSLDTNLPLPKGYLVEDCVDIRENMRIYTNGSIGEITSLGYNLYVLEIPKNAQKLILKTNSSLTFMRGSAANGYFNYLYPRTASNINRSTYNVTEAIIEIDTSYRYFGMTIAYAPTSDTAKLMTYEFI